VNIKNDDEESPLFYAAKEDVHEAFLALLEAGADCNVQNRSGKTPLMEVLAHGMKYVKPLIEKGANTNIKDTHDETAVSMAMRMGMINCCVILFNILRFIILLKNFSFFIYIYIRRF
jgi:ankyrin repeat protein